MTKLSTEEKFRRAVKAECRRQLSDFFKAIDPNSGRPMLEVLCAHAAVGYGINIGVQMIHPDGENESEPEPMIKIHKA